MHCDRGCFWHSSKYDHLLVSTGRIIQDGRDFRRASVAVRWRVEASLNAIRFLRSPFTVSADWLRQNGGGKHDFDLIADVRGVKYQVIGMGRSCDGW